MNIVILGAGAIGSHIAGKLAAEEYNVVLIDQDESCLERCSRDIDVMTRVGSGTDWQLLDDLMELGPEWFLALTGDDETKQVACSIAKNLGYPKTVARVHTGRYLNRTRLDFERIFGVDHLIGPELLVSQEIFKSIMAPGSIAMEEFAHGAAQMRTIEIPDKWRKGDLPLTQLSLPDGIMVGLIRRKEGGFAKTIFPHGDDHIRAGDEVTFIGETDVTSGIHQFFGLTQSPVESVVIAGGSLTGIGLAKLLSRQEVSTKIIDWDYDKCTRLLDELPTSTVIHHDAADLDFLKGERVAQSGVFVVCTDSDERNLLIAALAVEAGCEDVITSISNIRYVPIVRKLHLRHTASARINAANRVLSLVRSEAVTSMVSMYDDQAEILEVKVSLDSKFVGIPISELGPRLPEDFLIAIIQNRGRIMIANGNRILSPGDTMVVLTSRRHAREFHKIF